MMHAPWYNSYNYHYMEGETMRVMYEQWFVQHKVDMVFAGHVHAYERSVSDYFKGHILVVSADTALYKKIKSHTSIGWYSAAQIRH